MTITIPHWLLYIAYGVAGVGIVLVVGIIVRCVADWKLLRLQSVRISGRGWVAVALANPTYEDRSVIEGTLVELEIVE